jgi:glutamate synthase (NADPH/NADH) small chain
MLDHDVKYLKFKTFLNTYCPHCNNSFNIKEKGKELLLFKAKFKGEEIDLRMSPYLDVFEIEASVPIKEGEILSDLICPHCKSSLITDERKCEDCDSKVAKLIITAYSKLLPFFICLQYGCDWHGLTKADERRIRLKIPRQEMPEQDQKLRIHNFLEVPYGLTTELALLEAGRCLQCKDPDDSAKKMKERNILPAVCGRVCPQEDQCEELCILGIKDKPVAIGNLERFIADFERKMDLVKIPIIKTKLNKRIAVVGSGPGGITIAADLTLLGYSVTIFEALHQPGGVLVYGIPEFRLPKSIVNFEIDYLKRMGCKIELNHVIGNIYTIDELLENFDAIYIGVGAGLPMFMNISGENLCNVFSANEYLTRINLMKAYKFPEYDTPLPKGNKVVVVGGGNVAMDCARNALRTGSEEVTIVYRRSRIEMPARNEEIHHAEEEGIIFKLLTNPVKYLGNDQNWIKGVECIRMKLGEPDDSGRRRPVEIKDSNFQIDCDIAIVAIGNGPNPIIFETTPDLKRNKWGYIEVDLETMETSKEFVYAGGDIVTGSATVIQAMGSGRIAANAIHKKLSKAK